MKKLVGLSFCFIIVITICGCGVSKKTLEDAEKRIEALRVKGVPDSSLSKAKVFLYQAKDAKQRGNRGLAHKAASEMRILIAQGEEQYEKDMERLKPWIQNQRTIINKEIESITGFNRKHADSLIAIIDSFINIRWLLQAEAKTKEFLEYLPQLKSDEEKGKELRIEVVGTWECVTKSKHREDPTVNAVEKKIFHFYNDGKAKLVENKKGKSTPYFKEDWEFDSFGTFDLKGDTIMLLINRFKAVRQNFWDLKEEDGRKKWVMNKQPSYDSTITDGSQDRFIIYNDLTRDFKKK